MAKVLLDLGCEQLTKTVGQFSLDLLIKIGVSTSGQNHAVSVTLAPGDRLSETATSTSDNSQPNTSISDNSVLNPVLSEFESYLNQTPEFLTTEISGISSPTAASSEQGEDELPPLYTIL